MKREIVAVVLLAVLAAASVWNIRRADRLIGEIEQHLTLSEKAAAAGDPDYAEQQFEAALRIWLAARSYTGVFLRHPELDATSNAFYETLQRLQSGENVVLTTAYKQLRYHLDSITAMEHVSLGSVF